MIFSAALDAAPQEVLEARRAGRRGMVAKARPLPDARAPPGDRDVVDDHGDGGVRRDVPLVYILNQSGPAFSSTTPDFDIYTRALTDGGFRAAASEMVTLLLIVAVVIILGRVALRMIGRDAK